MRPYCHLLPGHHLVETCTRTFQGRFFLRPSRSTNEILLGVLGRALDRYHVDLYGFSFLGNHYHLLIGAESALQMARFQGHFKGNLAKKLGKLHGWRNKLWARRYRPMLVSDEPEAQLARLEYLPANGVKEGLVASPLDWPGPNMARAILDGEPLVGTWFNQTKEWAARRRGEVFEKYDYATRFEIELAPPPALSHLSREEYREVVADLVVKIEREASGTTGGRSVLGAERILTQDPCQRPIRVKKSPAPLLLFARSKEIVDRMRSDYRDFVRQYRATADHLRSIQRDGKDDLRAGFPFGSFPPALQFVGPALKSPPPQPPTRWLEYDEERRAIIGRGPVPVVQVPQRLAGAAPGREVSSSLRAPPGAGTR